MFNNSVDRNFEDVHYNSYNAGHEYFDNCFENRFVSEERPPFNPSWPTPPIFGQDQRLDLNRSNSYQTYNDHEAVGPFGPPPMDARYQNSFGSHGDQMANFDFNHQPQVDRNFSCMYQQDVPIHRSSDYPPNAGWVDGPPPPHDAEQREHHAFRPHPHRRAGPSHAARDSPSFGRHEDWHEPPPPGWVDGHYDMSRGGGGHDRPSAAPRGWGARLLPDPASGPPPARVAVRGRAGLWRAHR